MQHVLCAKFVQPCADGAVAAVIGKALHFNAIAKPLKFMANTPKWQSVCDALGNINATLEHKIVFICY